MQSYFTEENFRLIDVLEEIGKQHGKDHRSDCPGLGLTNLLITAPIVGAGDTQQLAESMEAAGYRLSDEEMTRLNEMTEWRR